MTRIRIVVYGVVEYEADPNNYLSPDPEKMLQVDIDNIQGDHSLIDALDGKWEVTGSIIA
jgi:hypothetical protein